MATPTTLPATFVAGNVLTAAQMNGVRGAFRVLQVVSTAKTDTFSSASSTYTDVTGLSVTITPSSTSSQIYVMASVAQGNGLADNIVTMQLVRGSTAICVGAAAGSRRPSSASFYAIASGGITQLQQNSIVFLDSPATTSATTYKIQVQTSGGTTYVNRTGLDTDSAAWPRTASVITVMEISA
jgi:hypothetical protein